MPGFNGSTPSTELYFANLGLRSGGAGSIPFGYSTIPSISGTNFYVETQLQHHHQCNRRYFYSGALE